MKTFYNPLILTLIISLFISCEKEDSLSTSFPYSYLDESDFIRNGLIGYYPFNGDTKDYSGNENDAIASNPTFTVDRYNYSTGAIQFNGIDDFLLIPNFGKLLADNEGTIVIWSKIDTPYMTYNQPKSVVLSIVDSINASFLLTSRMGTLGYSYGMYPELSSGSVTSSVNKEGFNLFILTFNDSSITKYYYTNEQYMQYSITNPKYSFGFNEDRKNQDLYLGKSIIDTFVSGTFDNYFTYFKGDIDDLLIYNRVLTEDEITYLFNLAEN